jgi:two-component system response regulator ChvI
MFASPEQNEQILKIGDLVMNDTCHTCTWKNRPVDLTVTEYKILQMLAASPSRIRMRDTLADHALGKESMVDTRTVDSHIKRIRRKFEAAEAGFGANRRSGIIRSVYGQGYRLGDGFRHQKTANPALSGENHTSLTV